MTEDVPTHVDLAKDFADSGVAEVLADLDRELVGLAPVKATQAPAEDKT